MKIAVYIVAMFLVTNLVSNLEASPPRCIDSALKIESIAKAPDIVQPVSAITDQQGRLLVIENHSHFRPDDYEGPETDRIRIVEDTTGDGLADRFSTFFEGEKDSMDLALHPDGSVYLATRHKIVRLVPNSDGVAGKTETIVELETDGDYPHNGLSGLAFDFDGNLFFGFGENLGKFYKVEGSDGSKVEGEADGGSVFWCTADGKSLRRVAGGFWNPFGQCVDSFGNLFAVDNDPDSSPPCRLIHVVEGGDYGYEFKFGRSGKHPLQTWNGTLPGTLPMVAGTGEAPCEVICYEHHGLPKEYRGDLLVASWGDHRIERFRLTPHGAGFTAERSIVVQGDASFWPVGMAVAKDGSLFITDWGSSSYPLHGEGQIWRLSMKSPPAQDNRPATGSTVRLTRQTACRGADQATTKRLLTHADELVRATAVQAASKHSLLKELEVVAKSDDSMRVRAVAVRTLAKKGADVSLYTTHANASLRAAAVHDGLPEAAMRSLLADSDATVRTRAISQLTKDDEELGRSVSTLLSDSSTSEYGLSVSMAARLAGKNSERLIPLMLKSDDERMRFVGARWAADFKRAEFLPGLREAIQRPTKDFKITMALLAAQRHVEGGKLDDVAKSKMLEEVLLDNDQSVETKISAIQSSDVETLDLGVIKGLVHSSDPRIQSEVIYLLAGDKRELATKILRSIVEDSSVPLAQRADALVSLDVVERDIDRLVALCGDTGVLKDTAARLLFGASLTDRQRKSVVEALGEKRSQRLLDPSSEKHDVDELLMTVKGRGDIARGRRLFANGRLLQCNSCHAVYNRGARIGPELTKIGRNQTRQELLRSILLPSERVSPQFQAWTIIDNDGKPQTGYHYSSEKRVETFIDAKGEAFDIHQDDIAERHALNTSIMPKGLVDHLTLDELSDLLAYLSD